MKTIAYCIVAISAICTVSCNTLQPINTSFERAGSLKKGNLDLMGHVSDYRIFGYGRNERLSRNLGVRAGVGVSEHFDFKVRYEKIKYNTNTGGIINELFRRGDYISFIPKWSLSHDEFSLLLPVSFYFPERINPGEKIKEKVYSISPQFMYTYTSPGKKFDLTAAGKTDFMFGREESNTWLSASFGMGFSSNLDRWAIRPEVALSFTSSEVDNLSYGIGFVYMLKRKRK